MKRGKFFERKRRTRSKLRPKEAKPRLSVFRSNKVIYGQIIDDKKGVTLAAFSSKNLPKKEVKDKSKVEIAQLVGENLAKRARKKRIKDIFFDRGGYKYHGAVKALAEGARKGGLNF